MADFRRLFTVLALVALFVGLASAQGGLTGGSTMACSSTTTVTPTVRSEGLTELVGDIVLNCTGGTPLNYGAQIPQANITVFLNTQVTSRIMNVSSNNASEALLLIDEPGSVNVTGYGATLPQNVCTTPLSGCVEFVGNIGANVGVPVTASGGAVAAQNVFQGVINSANAVTFYGVPILPPATTGSRIYRITNLRANANGISGGGPTPATVTGSVSISPSNAFTINQPLNTLAFITGGLATSFRNTSNSSSGSTFNANQCSTNNGASSNSGNGTGVIILRYGENFPTAFKTRMAFVTGGGPYATNANTSQNIPGQVYNSESGFTLNVNPAGASSPATNVTAGLADWGTRLKAVFSNIPSGVSIFVSTTNVANITTGATSGAGNPYAQMVASETVPDANGSLALATASVTYTSGSIPLGYAPVTISNGSGVAVWEVVQNNYTTNQNLDFGVYANYTGNAGGGTPLPGPMAVAMSYAPNATNGAFAASSGAVPGTVNIIPRFVDTSTAKTFMQINICQTVLLFPFVTTASGFETGLAISNTTQDVMGTTPQTGSCGLNWFQTGVGGTNPPLSTTPAIPGGTTFTTLASATTNAGANFGGYMIAVCNFQLAHGYAAITDVGSRGIFASYLPLVINTGTGTRASTETLSH